MRNYYGESNVIPVYIEVEDGERLIRAIKGEKQQETPKYEELCRRFLADQEDFSEEKIREAEIAEDSKMMILMYVSEILPIL